MSEATEPPRWVWSSARPSWIKIRASLLSRGGDGSERPIALEPSHHGLVKRLVEMRVREAHPRSHGHAACPRCVRIDVDAADDVVGLRTEDGVRERGSGVELRAVPFEIREVLRGRHRVRPPSPGEAWSGTNVVDARRPGCVVALVVLRPERLEDERLGLEPGGDLEGVGGGRHRGGGGRY